VGGAARKWEVDIKDEISPGSQIKFRLVMTKFNPPDVRIAYEIRLEPIK
jgi:hypothetical protein